MTVSSHSPTDMPDRRAASCAVSRASRLTPLTCQPTPDFMPAILVPKSEEQQPAGPWGASLN